jgi:hypothetical protein
MFKVLENALFHFNTGILIILALVASAGAA